MEANVSEREEVVILAKADVSQEEKAEEAIWTKATRAARKAKREFLADPKAVKAAIKNAVNKFYDRTFIEVLDRERRIAGLRDY